MKSGDLKREYYNPTQGASRWVVDHLEGLKFRV